MRRISSLACAVLLLAACSSAPPEDRSATNQDPSLSSGAQGTRGDATREGSGQEGKLGEESQSKTNRDGSGGSTSEPAEEGDPAAEPQSEWEGDGAGTKTAAAGDAQPGGGAREDSAARPRAGRYTYAQGGWEEFCAGTCNREKLPPTQAIDTSVDPSGNRLRVVTESRSSEERSITTTSFLDPSGLDITRIELRYGSFSNTYEPEPAVRSLQLPLRVGRSWSGSWEADTSGDYSARVLAKETLEVDGRRIETFKLDTVTHLRGEFRGTMTALLWVDPDTSASVRTSGRIRIQTDYGRFNSNFETMLIEGPGY